MAWFDPVDLYCERTGPEFWAEPVNAVTNAAFLLAAGVMAQRVRRDHLPVAWALVLLLALIGVGSFLFHTFANRLTALLDVLGILGFVLVYLYAATRTFFGASRWLAVAVTLGYFPSSVALASVFAALPGLGSSAGYAPIALLILIFAALLWKTAPKTARGLTLGAGILIVSLLFRTLDQPLCAAVPIGTHFLWHILNAVMLGFMIEVYRRHCLHERRLRSKAGHL